MLLPLFALSVVLTIVQAEFVVLTNKVLYKDYGKACADADLEPATVTMDNLGKVLQVVKREGFEEVWFEGYKLSGRIFKRKYMVLKSNQQGDPKLVCFANSNDKDTKSLHPLCFDPDTHITGV